MKREKAALTRNRLAFCQGCVAGNDVITARLDVYKNINLPFLAIACLGSPPYCVMYKDGFPY